MNLRGIGKELEKMEDRFYFCKKHAELDAWEPNKNAQRHIPRQDSTHFDCGIDTEEDPYISEKFLAGGRLSNLESKFLLHKKKIKVFNLNFSTEPVKGYKKNRFEG